MGQSQLSTVTQTTLPSKYELNCHETKMKVKQVLVEYQK